MTDQHEDRTWRARAELAARALVCCYELIEALNGSGWEEHVKEIARAIPVLRGVAPRELRREAFKRHTKPELIQDELPFDEQG